MSTIGRVILVAAYMLISSIAASHGDPTMAVCALWLLVVLLLWRPLQQRRFWAYAALVLMAAGARTAFAARLAPTAIFLPPVVINAGLTWMFGHTLLAGRVPLVTRLVRIMHAEQDIPDPSVWGYTRSVTWCWTALFAMNTLLCLGLALVGVPNGILYLFGVVPPFPLPINCWSFFSDIGCYLLVGLLFLLEYSYRRQRFPWQPYRNIVDFFGQAMAAGPALMAELAGEEKAANANL